METITSIIIGIGLSAACGFRVFVPLLIMSIASLSGHLHLAHGFEWIGSYPALVAFSVATALEIAGYYIPWLDHLLDTIASPAAIVAGTVATASIVTDMSPLLRWSLAIIAGGGAAGLVQGTTVGTRGLSLVGTGGLANPLISTLELVGAVVTSTLAILVPVAAAIFVAVFLLVVGRKVYRRSRNATTAQAQKPVKSGIARA
ncbi:MAG: DUF4126 domain-containing protein [Verrucomicrobia bacterium]|nr:MAG: DUF4126 domain-containing protein [Verrucomicrobiota bacterium]